MSNPSTDTTHSHTCAQAPDPEPRIEVTPSKEEIEAQEIEDQRGTPPQSASDKFAIGAGWMAHDKRYPDDPTKGIQLPHTVRAGIVTLHRLYELISQDRKICGKFDAPCIYAAVPKVRGCCKKTNVAYCQMVPVDLDETIKDEKGLERLRRFLRLYACVLYSSARHNPKAGVYRLRILFPVNASMSLEEYRRVSKAICLQLAAYLGTSGGIDACTEKAFQPMLIPGWADESFRDQAICDLYEGDIMDVTVLLAQARAQIEEEAVEEAARSCAVNSRARRPRGVSSSPTTAGALAGVDFGDGIDGLERARRDLDDLGAIYRGCGRSNTDLFRAACILVEWGVDVGDAIDEMQSRYSDQDPAWLEAKTRSAYARVKAHRVGRRLRAARAERALTWEGEFDLECAPVATPPVSVAADQLVTLGGVDSLRESTPCVTVQVVTDGRVKAEQVVTHDGPRRIRREVNIPELPDLPNFADLDPYRVIGVQSGTGTKKNVHLIPAIQKLQMAGGRIVSLGHLRSLTRRQSAGFGLPNYQDVIGQISGSTSICLDSIARVAAGPIDVVILDEAMQLFRHLFAETLAHKGQVGVVFTALRDVLRRARKIILLDADLDPTAFFFVRVLLGEEDHDELLIQNLFKAERHIRVRSLEGMFADIVDRVVRGEHVWLYCTSAEAAKAYDLRLRSLFPDITIALVYSETSAQYEAHFQDPSLFGAYQVVIASPSIGTGVSVEHVRTWHVFGDCMSGCGPTAKDVKQALRRARDALSITIAMHGRRSYESVNPEDHLTDLLTLSERTVRRLRGQVWAAKYQHGITAKEIPEGVFDLADTDGVIPEVEIHPYDLDICRIQAEVLADEARWGNHLHDVQVKDEDGNVIEIIPGALRLHLQEEGFILDDIPDDVTLDKEGLKEEAKKAKKAVKARHVELRDKARDLSILEAKALEDKGASSPEEAAELDRHKIRKAYGIEEGPVDKALIERDDRGRRRSKVRHYAQTLAAQRGEMQALDRLDRLDAVVGRNGKAQVITAQQGKRAKEGQISAALWTLFGVRDLEADAKAGTVLANPGDLSKFEDLAREVKRYLGITIPTAKTKKGKKGTSTHEGSPMLLARALAAWSGIKLSSTQVRLPDGQRMREYRLEREAADLMHGDATHYLSKITEPGKAVTPAANTMPTETQELLAGILDEAA